MAARELFKRCECAPTGWAKCKHGWHFRKMVKGRRVQVSLDEWLGHEKVRLVADADRVRDQIVDLLREGTFAALGPPDSPAVRQAALPRLADGWTLASVVDAYVQTHRDDTERGAGYCANLASSLKQAVAWPLPDARRGIVTLGELPIGAVTTAHLEAFYKSRVAAGRSASTRNKLVNDLRRLGAWTVTKGYRTEGWLEKAQTQIRRRKEARRRRRLALAVADLQTGAILRESEEDRLLAAAGAHLHDLIVAGIESVQRLGELLALQWRDVDLARRRLRIYDCKDPDGVTFRDIPISRRLLAVLERRRVAIDGTPMEATAFVFGNEIGEPVGSVITAWENAVLKAHGHPVEREKTTKALTAAARAAYGQADLIFHDLRHEGASRLLEAGWPVHHVSAMLGHKSLETTSIYLNVRAGDLDAAMAAHEARRVAQSGAAPQSGAQVAQGGETGALAATPKARQKRR